MRENNIFIRKNRFLRERIYLAIRVSGFAHRFLCARPSAVSTRHASVSTSAFQSIRIKKKMSALSQYATIASSASNSRLFRLFSPAALFSCPHNAKAATSKCGGLLETMSESFRAYANSPIA